MIEVIAVSQPAVVVVVLKADERIQVGAVSIQAVLIHAIGKLLQLGYLVRHLAHLIVARLLARCHRRRGRHSARHHCRLAEHVLSAAVCLARVLLAILLIERVARRVVGKRRAIQQRVELCADLPALIVVVVAVAQLIEPARVSLCRARARAEFDVLAAVRAAGIVVLRADFLRCVVRRLLARLVSLGICLVVSLGILSNEVEIAFIRD